MKSNRNIRRKSRSRKSKRRVVGKSNRKVVRKSNRKVVGKSKRRKNLKKRNSKKRKTSKKLKGGMPNVRRMVQDIEKKEREKEDELKQFKHLVKLGTDALRGGKDEEALQSYKEAVALLEPSSKEFKELSWDSRQKAVGFRATVVDQIKKIERKMSETNAPSSAAPTPRTPQNEEEAEDDPEVAEANDTDEGEDDSEVVARVAEASDTDEGDSVPEFDEQVVTESSQSKLIPGEFFVNFTEDGDLGLNIRLIVDKLTRGVIRCEVTDIRSDTPAARLDMSTENGSLIIRSVNGISTSGKGIRGVKAMIEDPRRPLLMSFTPYGVDPAANFESEPEPDDQGGVKGLEPSEREEKEREEKERQTKLEKELDTYTEDVRSYIDGKSSSYEYNVIRGVAALLHYKEEKDRGLLPECDNLKNIFDSTWTLDGSRWMLVIGCKGLYFGPKKGFDTRSLRRPIGDFSNVNRYWDHTKGYEQRNKTEVREILKALDLPFAKAKRAPAGSGWEDSFDEIWRETREKMIVWRDFEEIDDDNGWVLHTPFMEALVENEQKLKRAVRTTRMIPYGLISDITLLEDKKGVRVVLVRDKKEHATVLGGLCWNEDILGRDRWRAEFEITPGVRKYPHVYAYERLTMKKGEFKKKMNMNATKLMGNRAEEKEREIAATKIQGHFLGHLSRKQQREAGIHATARIVKGIDPKTGKVFFNKLSSVNESIIELSSIVEEPDPKKLAGEIIKMDGDQLVAYLASKNVGIVLKNKIFEFWMKEKGEEGGDAPVNAAPVEQGGLGVDLDEFSEDEDREEDVSEDKYEDEEDEPEPMEASADEGGRGISIDDIKRSLKFLGDASLEDFAEMGEEDLLINMVAESLPIASKNWILDKIKDWKQGGDKRTVAEESIDYAKRRLNMAYKPTRPQLKQ